MKAWFSSIAATAAIGLVACVFLIPDEDDISLQYFRDQRFKEAFGGYKAQWEGGNHSVSVAIPLSTLHLQYGNVEEAVSCMETFVAESPDTVEAYRLLGTLYQYAQRPGDYLSTLERLRELEPTVSVLRELSDIYNFHGEYELQLGVLRQLNSFEEVEASDCLKLCHLCAALDRIEEAAQAAVAFCDGEEGGVAPEFLEFTASLLLEAKNLHPNAKNSAAVEEFVVRHLQEGLDIEGAARVSSLMLMKGNADLGLRLLEPFREEGQRSDRYIAALVDLEMAQGNIGSAYNKLWRRFIAGDLSPSLMPQLVSVLMEKEAVVDLESLIAVLPVETLDSEQAIELAVFILKHRLPEHARLLTAAFSDESLQFYPLVDLLCTVAMAERPQDVELTSHRSWNELDEEELVVVARSLLHAGLGPSVQKYLLEKLPLRRFTPDLLTLWIDGLLKHGDVGEVRRILMATKADSAGPTWSLLWGKMLIASGDEQQLLEWMKQSLPAPEVLEGLLAESRRRERFSLSVTLAAELLRRVDTVANQLTLAEVLIAANREMEALPSLRKLHETSALGRQLYRDALVGASEDTSEVVEELHAFLASRASGSLSETEHRETAYLLLEVCGDKSAAEALFTELAAAAPADGVDVRQLVYMWGPRPGDGPVAWLVERAVSTSSPEERLLWAEHLIYVDAVAEAMELLQDCKALKAQQLIAQGLAKQRRTGDLAKHLAQWMQTETAPDNLLWAAKFAHDHLLLKVSESIYQRVLELQPEETRALAGLGVLSYQLGKRQQSEATLARYFSLIELTKRDDANEVSFAAVSNYADILWVNGDHSKAKRYYRHYLRAANKKMAQRSLSTPETVALALVRTGRVEDGISTYYELLKVNPQNGDLRVTLAHILMDEGRHKEADRVLSVGSSTR